MRASPHLGAAASWIATSLAVSSSSQVNSVTPQLEPENPTASISAMATAFTEVSIPATERISSKILELERQAELRFADVLQVVFEALGPEHSEQVFRDWTLLSRNLEESRQIAEFVVSTQADSPPEWAKSLAESLVTGVYYLRPEPSLGSVVVTHGLVERFAVREGTDMVQSELSIYVNDDRVSQTRFALPEVPYPHTLEILLSEFTPGSTVRLVSQFTVWTEEDSEHSHSLTQNFRIIEGPDGEVTFEPLRDEFSPIDPLTVEIDESYRALQSVIHVRDLLSRELTGEIHHSGIESPLLGLDAPRLDLVPWGATSGALRSNEQLDFTGQVTLLDFWAAWCGPCIIAFPKLSDLHEQYPELQVVSVCSTRTEHDQRGAERHADGRYAHLFAKGSPESLDRYQVSAYPTLVLVGPDGVVHWVGQGANSLPSPELIERLIDQSAQYNR